MTNRQIDPSDVTQADADALAAKLGAFAETLPDREWAALGAILAQAQAGAPDTAGHIAVGEPSPSTPGVFRCGTPAPGGGPVLPGISGPFWVGPHITTLPAHLRR